MAQAMLADEVTEAVSWLTEHDGATGLSYVFKINHIKLDTTGQLLTWKDYTKEPSDNDLTALAKGAETSLDITNRDEGQDDIPEDSKRSVIILCAVVKRVLFELFKTKDIEAKEIKWFMQAEWSKDQEFHIHVLLWGDKVKQVQGKWWQKFLNGWWSRFLVASLKPVISTAARIQIRERIEKDLWVDVLQYKHSQTRKEYAKLVDISSIIANYFLRKDAWWLNKPSIYYCSFDSDFKMDQLSFSQRLAVSKLFLKAKQTGDVEVRTETAQDRKRQRIETTKEKTIKDICDMLFANRIITAEDWMLFDPDSYVHIMTQPSGDQLIRNTLEISTLRLSKTLTAFQLIKEKHTEPLETIEETKIFEILKAITTIPYKCIHAIMCCLNRQMGKRNTILFYGPATTGKSLLAQALCYLVGNVGCYNPANVNFPFNDCTNKNIIWVEEAGNFGQQVNQFKAICSGQTIRIDQKGKGSKSIAPTPVIMTTNEDITQVGVGCEPRPEHTQPIRDRMLGFNLTTKLPGDFGLIPTEEWANIFDWMVGHYYEPTLTCYVKRWGSPPVWEEDWTRPDWKGVVHNSSLLNPANGRVNPTQDPDRVTPPDLADLLDAWEKDELLDDLQPTDSSLDIYQA
nr:NS1 [Tusavirus 1]